jgi:hypothetical protein
MVAGPSGCGKTHLVTEILKQIGHRFHKILWCNAESNAITEEITNLPNIEILNNIPETFENLPKKTLIILDDMMLDAYKKNICSLFTKGVHHRQLSVCLITQNIFHQAKYARDISLNCNYLIIFKNPRDKSQILPLARQIHPENFMELLRVYNEATCKPHTYIFFDLCSKTNDLLRIRSEILTPKHSVVYCSKNLLDGSCEKHETVDGQQTYITCFENV